jgi:predicted nucleic acid-binding protein
LIVLDTNVISEPLRGAGEPAVRDWLNAQSSESLYTTAINLAELFAGVVVLPAGRRQTELDARLRSTLARLFGPRVLSFDTAAAESYATIAREAKAQGLGVPHEDGLIAAIARAHGFAVATRNVSDFAGTGVVLINPWEFQADAT